jgi:hypothetical protein
MTVTRSRNLTFELRTYGQSMISRHTYVIFARWSVHGE